MDKDERWFYRYSQDKCDQNLNIEGLGPLLFRQGRGTFFSKVCAISTCGVDNPSSPARFTANQRLTSTWHHFSRTSSTDPFVSPVIFLQPLANSPIWMTHGLYFTWKLYIIGVPLFFGNQHQSWNKSYKAAQWIFQGPASLAVRSGIEVCYTHTNLPTCLARMRVRKIYLTFLHSGANSNTPQFG